MDQRWQEPGPKLTGLTFPSSTTAGPVACTLQTPTIDTSSAILMSVSRKTAFLLYTWGFACTQ